MICHIFFRVLKKTAPCFSIISAVSVWCCLDVKAGNPDGQENRMHPNEKGIKIGAILCAHKLVFALCVVGSAVSSLPLLCLGHDSALVGPWSGCTHVPASSEPGLQILALLCHVLGRALGRQWFTSKNKYFARVGLRRDYLLNTE